MKVKLRGFAVGILAVAVFAAEAKAAPQGSIVINPSPTIGAGSITAQGNYMAANGWTPQPVQLHALPQGGGLDTPVTGTTMPAKNQWEPITISNLAPGSYVVYALMTLKKEGSQPDTVCSPVSVVTVVAKGGAPPALLGTASYAKGDPTTATGSVSVTNMGTYTKNMANYKVTGCGLAVIPANGGDFPTSFAKQGPAPGANWGPITITGLPSGLYYVVGSVTMTLGDGTNPQNIQTPVVTLSVP